MKRFFLFSGPAVLGTALLCTGSFGQNAWINEIHYDNAGADTNEFIEIVLEDPGSYDLALFEVVLYNGNGGNAYNAKTLNLFTEGASAGNFTIYYYIYPANGIQNGAPDGMAIAYNGLLISGQLLSYEGAFIATSGPANGIQSVDIGVDEEPGPAVGLSLQLAGAGSQYSSFAWQEAGPETPGQPNNGQNLGGTLLPEPSDYPSNFIASANSLTIALNWADASGSQPPQHYLVIISDQDNIEAPGDGVPVEDDRELSDGLGALNIAQGLQNCLFYRLESETSYFFRIYPYTNSDTLIDYKTDGTAPSSYAVTEPVILTQDFESGILGPWTKYSVSSDQEWEISGSGGAYQTQYFGQMDAVSENEPGNDWLISPPVDLSALTGKKMVFFTRYESNDPGGGLSLKYSMDYSGGNPMGASWAELSFSIPLAQDIWTNSGNIDLDGIPGDSVHFAFHYLSNGIPCLWGVDEMVITGYPDIPVYIPRLMITEIMYNPPESGTDTLEFIELCNHDTISVNLAGYHFAAGVNFTFSNFVLNPGEYFLIAADSARFQNFFGIPARRFNGTLSNNGELLLLRNHAGILVDSVMYDNAGPWPVRPDGFGPSLTFCNYSLDNALGENWSYSLEFAGVNAGGDSVFASPGEQGWMLPVADFTADQTIVQTGESVNFSDLSTGIPQYWAWIFTGGNPDFHEGQIPPPVNYSIPGAYNVTLTVSNPAGTSLYERVEYILVGDPPVADFMANQNSLYQGETLDFIDLTTNEPTSWIWEFEGGDPDHSAYQNPGGIRYADTGLYDVLLVVSNIFGTSELLKEDYIDVMPVGIGEHAGGLVHLYPNPSNGFFRLVNPGLLELEVMVFDETGRLVAGTGSRQGTIDFNLSAYGKGVFFLQVMDAGSGQVSWRKVVIK